MRAARTEKNWELLGSSTRGSAHDLHGLPNQDAYDWFELDALEPTAVVAAVADGHGHFRHFRSQRGAELAVEQAGRSATELAGRLAAIEAPNDLGAFAAETLVPSIVTGWREAVTADIALAPFSDEEDAVRAVSNDPPLIAYGSTLLVALLGARWAIAAQIGDGDIVALMADGRVVLPVPDDPSLDGRYTTSLCQPSAIGSFRAAVIDREATPVLALLMATDGFGNAQTADPWPAAVGRDVMTMRREHGVAWVREQLPKWTARCASREGSGDDTTVVLAFAAP